MRPRHPHRDLAFLINDVGRMLRTYADQEARRFGMTPSAMGAAEAAGEQPGASKQTELAEMLDLQPITVTRLVDRLCDNGLIERSADPNDRRPSGLFSDAGGTAADGYELDALGNDLMTAILDGLPPEKTDAALTYLGAMRDKPAPPAARKRRRED